MVKDNTLHRDDNLGPLLDAQKTLLVKVDEHAKVNNLLESLTNDIVQLRQQLREMTASRDIYLHKYYEFSRETDRLEVESARIDNEREEMRRALGEAQDTSELLVSDREQAFNELEDHTTTESSARAHIQDDLERSQAELKLGKGDLAAEKEKTSSLATSFEMQSYEMLELRRSATKLEASLSQRLSRIEEGIQHRSVNVSDSETDQSGNLHDELVTTKQKVSLEQGAAADQR
jgi:chromosome segregation ATPase